MERMPRTKRLQGTDWLSQLHEDVLWTILGFLDLATLYTARLVCKRFRKPAARHFKALDCTTLGELPTTDFTQFSGTTYLAVTVSHESHLQSLAHPRIAPVVTHVSLKGFRLRDSQGAEDLEAVLMRLPKLRLVSLRPLVGDSHLPLFPPTLEELQITDQPYSDRSWREHGGGLGNASPLTRYSQLTSLAIDLVVGAGPSMASLSTLHNLRSLNLHSCSAALGPLSTLTALTSLTFEQRDSGEEGSVFEELGRLTGLSRLVLLMIRRPRYVEHEDLACIAQLTNLTCLDMSGCWLDDSIATSTALVALTRLVSVCFNPASISVLKVRQAESRHHPVYMPQLSLPQLEALQSLGLGDAADVSILWGATGLTHLELSCEIQRCDPYRPDLDCGDVDSLQGLRPAVAGMSRLRSLEISVLVHEPEDSYLPGHNIGYDDEEDSYLSGQCGDDDYWPVVRLDGVLRACTMLTKLAYRGPLQPDRDLETCAALPSLRSLTFDGIRELTPAWLPALQAMSGLTELSLVDTGICAADMTPAVIAAFDAERRQLGWPLIKLRVESWNERHERPGAMHRVCAEGTEVHLGTFPDPVRAAMEDDKAAAEDRGARAFLNVLFGYNSSPILAGAHDQPAELPLGGGHGQECPATTVPAPQMDDTSQRRIGYLGVRQDGPWYHAQMCKQGKMVSLGSFPDPVSAARRYDKQAAEYYGAIALLNFPSGRCSGPTVADAHHEPAELPLGGGCGQDGPPTCGRMPPDSAEGPSDPPSGTLNTHEGRSGK